MKQTSLRRRRSIRLRGYDYGAPGTYFVTLCAFRRKLLFAAPKGEKILLNPLGRIVSEEWVRTPFIREEAELDEFVVMPNHFHGIVILKSHAPLASGGEEPEPPRAHGRAPLRRPPRSLGSLIAGFKAVTTKRINELRGTTGAKVWQRGFFEHIIRNEDDLNGIRKYISENPLHWHEDQNNPNRFGED